MKVLFAALLLATAALMFSPALSLGDPPHHQKVTICHVPPGNPSNAHTIKVDASAVPAHLAHGDSLGECPEPPQPPECPPQGMHASTLHNEECPPVAVCPPAMAHDDG
jgi:hypothetical protein